MNDSKVLSPLNGTFSAQNKLNNSNALQVAEKQKAIFRLQQEIELIKRKEIFEEKMKLKEDKISKNL